MGLPVAFTAILPSLGYFLEGYQAPVGSNEGKGLDSVAPVSSLTFLTYGERSQIWVYMEKKTLNDNILKERERNEG